MTGIELIKSERKRQVESEGWTHEHDDAYDREELEAAALCYLYKSDSITPPSFWPWDSVWWKPSDKLSRNLIKGGALYLAETERLERAGATEDDLFNRHQVLDEIAIKIDKAKSAGI